MDWQGKSPRRSLLRWVAVFSIAAITAGLASGVASAADLPGLPILGGGNNTTTSPTDPGDLPVNPEWLANTLTRASTTSSVQNNLAPGALESRNQALKEWSGAQ